MQLTSQQLVFVDAVVDGSGHKCLRARAGTGKTSTIIASVMPYTKKFPTHEIAICAFGKAIQVEIDGKLKKLGIDWKQCQAVTTHSLGFGLVRFAFKGVKVENNKVRDLLRAQNQPVYKQFFGAIGDLVHLAKLEGFGFFDDVQIGDTHAWYRMAEHYGINGFDNTSDMDRVIEAAQYIYKMSLHQTDVVDFDDMVLFPLVHNLRVRFGKDLIYLDEAQDTSRARRALVKKFLKPTGRLMIVGDDRQCQPAGTMVYASGRGEVPIEKLRVGDELLTYCYGYFRGKKSLGRKVEAVASRTYSGSLIKITAGGHSHEVTPNHRCVVRLADRPGSVVYVARRGKQARVGRCKISHRYGFGIATRGVGEDADEVWAVKFFDESESEAARILEATIGYKYGLPQMCFHYNDRGGKVGAMSREKFWKYFPDNLAGLDACLRDCGLERELPFWSKGAGKHVGSKYSFEAYAANLFDGWMRVCLFDNDPHTPRWETAKITRRAFKGKVYSLKVQTNEAGKRLYVANGIVTHNSIMGFAGASANALDEMIEEMRAEVLPLTMTWRCPKAVVTLAQRYVPDIQAADSAIEGKVTKVTELPAGLLPTDAILCRNTAPLVEQAYALIRRGVACKVEGREIGSGLERMILRWKTIKTVTAFLDKLEDWQARESQKAIAKGKEEKVQEIADKCDTLRVICQATQDKISKQRSGAASLDDVRVFINELFSDDVTKQGYLTLVSGHRSKGREWPRVFLIEFEKRKFSPYDKQPWQIRQSENVAYVMLTRAQRELVFVN